MFVRSSGEGAAKMHVSRFDVLVTLAYVTSTVLWVVVPVGWPKTSTPPCHRPPRIERRDGAHGRTRTAGLLLTKELLCQRVNCGGLAGVGSGPMATKWSQDGYRQRSSMGGGSAD